MRNDQKVKVSKYMSYLLRHNPENLEMDEHGFVEVKALWEKLSERFQVDKNIIHKILEDGYRKRFEIVGDRIRALYGHSVPVALEFVEAIAVKVLYHGTTIDASRQILEDGLKPMKRNWVHLSPTSEIATEVGLRRTRSPTILEINVKSAREDGVKFYKATNKVYLCREVGRKHIKLARPS